MMVLAYRNGAFSAHHPWPRGITLLAASAVAAYQILFFTGIDAAGVAVGTIVGIGSAPMIAGALSWLVFKERPGRRWLAATAIAILGCILLVLPGSQLEFQAWGVILAIGGGACYSIYALCIKRLIQTQPTDAVMAVIFCLGALLLSPLLLWLDLSWLSEPRGLAVAIYLGLATNALPNILFGRGFKRVPTANAITLTLAEPLTAGLLGVFLLGEVLAPISWVGIILLVIGLLILSY